MRLKLVYTIGIVLWMVMGVGSCDRGASDEIRIGALLPLTGDGAKYGEAARNGIELAVTEVNGGGGIAGKPIVVSYEDSQGNPRKAVDGFRKLVTFDNVPAVIGDLFSSATLAVAPLANQNRVVLLSPASSAPEISDAGPWVFRNVASDIFEGSVMAEFLRDSLGIDEASIVRINNAYGNGISEVFAEEFEAHGGKIVSEHVFPEGESDFRPLLLSVKRHSPEVLYIVGYRELGPLLKQAEQLQLNAQYLSTVMFEDPEILEIAGSAAEGVIYSARAYDPTKKKPSVQEFVSNFQETYDTEPDIFAALSYDAIKILATAMEKSGTSPEDIREGLLEIQDYPAVTGSTTFLDNGDVIQPALIKTVRDGEFDIY